ncbi:alpha/beta hydrolase [Gordonia crocea]|uniref:Alpha/beta hydrolase n=1 Tax=Gordonia crocea TaxID=589162 RepID=A0A7I9UYA9_9ACTN|nr:alpha/beta hydrolase [Gordonia crocea]GED97943.1 alpha/beta hydrolase [Gordonia crocea]
MPLDYDSPQGRTAEIAVLKVPARGQRIGSLVVNPGGPGGPGVPMAAGAATTWARSALTERFDVIGFDPRGVGASTPAIRCFSDAEVDRGEAAMSATVGLGKVTEAGSRALVDRCAEHTGGMDALQAMSTRSTVRDLDVLREAIGDSKLNFLGQSYGTRLGAVYAEMFPKKVRALVLDGAVDPNLDTSSRRVIQWRGFQRAFDQLAAFCSRQSDCPLGSVPAQATERFLDLVRPLIDDPIPAGDRGSFGFNEAYRAVTSGLYVSAVWHVSAVWPVLIKGLGELQHGEFATLQKVADSFAGRTPDGRYGNFSQAIFAINCMDEDRHTPQQESALKREIQQAAPFTDAGRGSVTRDPCEFWPGKPTLGYPYANNIVDLPQSLVISVTGDPSTPYASGVALATAPGGAVLTVEGEQHTVAYAGTSDCVNTAVAEYLVDLRIPSPDTRCVLS